METESYGDGLGSGVEVIPSDCRTACQILVACGVFAKDIPELKREDESHFIRPTPGYTTRREKWVASIKERFESRKASGRIPAGLEWSQEVETSLEGLCDDYYDEYLANVVEKFGSIEAARQHITQLSDGGTPAAVFSFAIARPGSGPSGLSERDVRAVRDDLLRRIGRQETPSVFWAADGAQLHQLGGTEAAGSIVGCGIDGRGRLIARIAATSPENAKKLRARRGLDYWVSIRRKDSGVAHMGGYRPKGSHIERIALAEPEQKPVQFADTADCVWTRFTS